MYTLRAWLFAEFALLNHNRTTLWREADLEARVLQSACSCSRWLQTSLLDSTGDGGLQKKARTACEWHSQLMTPSETLLRLSWGFGKIFARTSSPGFCPISRAHVRDRKTLRKRVHHKESSLLALRGKNAAITQMGFKYGLSETKSRLLRSS